jgi:hypothetical protein
VLLKVGRINKLDPDPPAPVVFFLLSHPPLVQRLAATEAWAAAQHPAGRAPRPRRLTPRARAPPRPDDRRTTGR